MSGDQLIASFDEMFAWHFIEFIRNLLILTPLSAGDEVIWLLYDKLQVKLIIWLEYLVKCLIFEIYLGEYLLGIIQCRIMELWQSGSSPVINLIFMWKAREKPTENGGVTEKI